MLALSLQWKRVCRFFLLPFRSFTESAHVYVAFARFYYYYYYQCTEFNPSSILPNVFDLCLTGYFCPALSIAVKTMKKEEKALLTVKPQCKCPLYSQCYLVVDYCRDGQLQYVNVIVEGRHLLQPLYLYLVV